LEQVVAKSPITGSVGASRLVGSNVVGGCEFKIKKNRRKSGIHKEVK
jgi:hypothetical protein